MMRLLLLLPFLIPASIAVGADLSVAGGTVQATWTEPRAVSIASDAVLRAGHAVTISIAGQVDINQEQKSERHCGILGIGCNTEHWIEHHFVNPDQTPVLVQIRQVGSDNIVDEKLVNQTPVTMQVPQNIDFTKKYELVAILQGTRNRAIDPKRSASAYSVLIDIDATQRSDYFPVYLGSIGSNIDLALNSESLDRALLNGHAKAVASTLRNFAVSRFPATETTNRIAHEKLLRKADAIAPDDPANALALAEYYRTVGLYALADETLQKTLSSLEGKSDPLSLMRLGDAYSIAAATDLAKFGGMNVEAAQEAAALYAKASASYEAAARRDLQAGAMISRAKVLRGLRTREGLKTATKLLQSAFDLTPETLRFRTLAASPDGRNVFGLDWTAAFTISPISDYPASSSRIEHEAVVAFDPEKQSLLVEKDEALWWHSLDANAKLQPTSILKSPFIEASGGAILTHPADGQIRFATPDGQASLLKYGETTTCAAPPPPAPDVKAFALMASSLGPKGEVIAASCNGTLYLYSVVDGVPTSRVHTDKFGTPANLKAGPPACGAIVQTATDPFSMEPNSTILVKLDGSEVVLDVSHAAPPAQTVPSPTQAEFTSDNVALVLVSGSVLMAFRCNDGGRIAAVDLPRVESTEPTPYGERLPQSVRLQRLSANTFAVVDSGKRINVFEWPSQRLRSYDFPKLPLFNAFQLMGILLPPAAVDAPPRFLRYERLVTVQRQLSEEEDISDPMSLPPEMLPSPSFLLNGGRYLLSFDDTIGRRLTDTQSGIDLPLPANSRILAMPLDGIDQWAALREMPGPVVPGTALMAVDAVDVLNGASISATTTLPATVSPQALQATVEALNRFAAFWANIPAEAKSQPEPVGIFPRNQIENLVKNPDRLRFHYVPVPHTPSLAKEAAPTAQLVCSTLSAIDDSGQEKLVPLGGVPSVPVLITFRDGKPSLLPLPWTSNCVDLRLISGAVPTVLVLKSVGPKASLEWVQNGVWTKVLESPHPIGLVAGRSDKNGSLLLLINEAQPGGETFSIKKLSASTGLVNACSGCTGLRPPQLNVDTSSSVLDQFFGPVSAGVHMSTDKAAEVIAYPADDETVVYSMTAARDLLRTKRGIPILLTKEVLVLARSDGLVELNPLSIAATEEAPK
ncbi:tetratricopeptide repeat protein [Rhizobium ruizarguesonis]